MRDYTRIPPKFWISKEGREVKRRGIEALVVCLYLWSAPSSNMLGLYYVSIGAMADETGLGVEGASKGLQGCIEAGVCDYDSESQVVWVFAMAEIQIGTALKPSDNQVKGVRTTYEGLVENPFLARFYERYGQAFHMDLARGDMADAPRPLQAPMKPLRTQAQAQAQEKAQKQAQVAPPPASPPPDGGDELSGSFETPAEALRAATWAAYDAAFQERYRTRPVRNSKANALIKQLVERLGKEAPMVAAFYVSLNRQFYVSCSHALDALVKDCEGIRTQWATGSKVTDTVARSADRRQTNAEVFTRILDDQGNAVTEGEQ
jgi:hypothetical protein